MPLASELPLKAQQEGLVPISMIADNVTRERETGAALEFVAVSLERRKVGKIPGPARIMWVIIRR
jgi:hypothetical protein